MKQLTCEMCGSTDMMKQDGVFVCQTCGTKYSVEEAKKMMIEGTVDVSGSTVKVDNSDSVNTYLTMAENAYSADNYTEAEVYCNKVIEIDPQNYDAWMLKGRAAGWQSGLRNNRLGEAINCFLNAINLAPEEPQPITLNLNGHEVQATMDIKARLIDKATDQIKAIAVALVNLQGERFAKWPDEEEKTGCVNMVTAILNPITEYMKVVHSPVRITAEIATSINNATTGAWNNVVCPEFNNANHGFPDDDDWRRFIDRADLCIELLGFAIDLTDLDDDGDIARLNNLIDIEELVIKSKSYKWVYVDYRQYVRYDSSWEEEKRRIQMVIDNVKKVGAIPDVENSGMYVNNLMLTDDAKDIRRNTMKICREKIEKCKRNIQEKKVREAEEKRREQEERNNEYWNNHADEKKQLESERDSLQSQLTQLQDQFAPYEKEISSLKKKRDAETPSKEEEKTVKKQISDLEQQKSNLGMFKGKEKKSLQAQIDELHSRLPKIKESIAAEEKEQRAQCNAKISEIEQKSNPIKQKIEQSQNRINEITTELTKDR